MNEPKKPPNPPENTEAEGDDRNRNAGVPPEADQADAKGLPNSDRQDTETAAGR